MNGISWIIFIVIAILIVMGVAALRRFWDDEVNLSDEDIALERRMSSLNREQANRRPDDEIVRLLRGKEQPTVGEDE